MPNFPIDIPLPDDVKRFLATPHCADIKLPKPGKVSVCLPMGGGKIQGLADVTKTIPDDCTLTFSILLQLPAILIPLGCIIKVAKLAKPVLKFKDAVSSGNPFTVVTALAELMPAVVDVVNCFAQFLIGIPFFVRDVLLLIANVLRCLGENLKSIAGLLGGLQVSMETAHASGNTALLEQLQCAEENAQSSADAMMSAVEPLSLILDLMAPLLELTPGVPTFKLPSVAPVGDLQALTDTANTMIATGDAIKTVAQALPSC